jgi:hypothetical protein
LENWEVVENIRKVLFFEGFWKWLEILPPSPPDDSKPHPRSKLPDNFSVPLVCKA